MNHKENQISPSKCVFTSVQNLKRYNGTRSTTKSGRTCQNWLKNQFWDYKQSIQCVIFWRLIIPHQPHFTVEIPSDANLDHNFCRPTENFDMPWCYTTDPLKRYEDCFEICSNEMGDKELEITLENIKEVDSTSETPAPINTTTVTSTTMFSRSMFNTTLLSTTMFSTTMQGTTTAAKTTNIIEEKRQIAISTMTVPTTTTGISSTTAKSNHSTTSVSINERSTESLTSTIHDPKAVTTSKTSPSMRPSSSIHRTIASTVIPTSTSTKMSHLHTTKTGVEIDELLQWQPVTDKRDKSIATGWVF